MAEARELDGKRTVPCNEGTCQAPAVSIVTTRNLGRTAAQGQETKILWDIENWPRPGYAKATPVCGKHRDELLDAIAEVLG